MNQTPLCLCGFTLNNKLVLGGAFQLADTHGIPLWFSMDKAAENNAVISMPHYFASAIEAGWDSEKTFGKIRETLADRGDSKEDVEKIKLACIAMFMQIAESMPGKTATEIARKLRETLELKPIQQ